MQEPNSQQIQAVIISQDTIEMLAELDTLINDSTLGVTIPSLGLFCQKTGHLIGNRNENSIYSLIKICGKDVAGNLYNATSLCTHPAWIHTDPESLDDLMVSDPIGYACYCFGLLTIPFYQTKKNESPLLQPWSEKYWAMARANALLNAKGVAGLDKLNHALVRCLTFIPDSTQYLFRRIKKFAQTPDQLALLHCSGELTALLHEATNKALDSLGMSDAWIKRTRFIDIASTPEDAARGPSNVRKQKLSKRTVAEASMFAELSKLFKDEGLDILETMKANTPGTTAWRAKYMSREQLREVEQMADLEELAKISNLVSFSDDAEEDDNSVEIRAMGVRNEPSLDTVSNNENNNNENKEIVVEQPEQLVPIAPKPLSLLARIRAKKEQ